MDGPSVGAGIAFGIAIAIWSALLYSLFRRSIMWKVDDKLRAGRDDTQRKFDSLAGTMSELRREIGRLDQQLIRGR
jgi:hypothetical protein